MQAESPNARIPILRMLKRVLPLPTCPCSSGAASPTLEAGGVIRVASLSQCGAPTASPRFVVAADDKSLRTWSVSSSGDAATLSLSLLGETKLVKKPADVVPALLKRSATAAATAAASATSTPSEEPVLIVADRIGEAYAVPDPAVGARRRPLVTHTASIITAVAVTPGSDFFLTGDRDARIRVSCFPHAWSLAAVCSGHTKFVSALAVLAGGVGVADGMDRPLGGGLPAKISSRSQVSSGGSATSMLSPESSGRPLRRGYASGELLLSGGGDGTLRLWHWRSGVLLHTLYLTEAAAALSPLRAPTPMETWPT